MQKQVSDAFDGNKKDWREVILEQQVQQTHSMQTHKVEQIMSKAVRGRKSSQARKDNLAPIIEENQIVPATEDEAKKKKNEELKKRVKMLTMASKSSAVKKEADDTESQISSAPDHTFLTKTKGPADKKKGKKKDD